MVLEVKPKTEAAPVEDTMTLELAIYTRYVRADVLYEKGHAYRFTNSQAKTLLMETDEVNGMPIWKMWRGAKSKQVVVEREVLPQDMTQQAVVALPTPDETTNKGVLGIHVGDDAEIADLLPKGDGETDSADGAITV